VEEVRIAFRRFLSSPAWFRLSACLATGALLAGGLLPAQSIIQFPLPAAGQPVGMGVGPDGALWFTDWAGKIGRITTSGAITEFPVPGGGGQPTAIAAGPDGNLWFTEWTVNKIGRITTSGAITEFTIPTGNAQPYGGIVAGPDGNLWFTEWVGNKIGRITTSGVFTEFPVPTASSAPYGIALGPDGALWFAENTANKIGRITTSGVITEFPIPASGHFPQYIAAGPDGNLWFTENSGTGNHIGRITTTGVIAEFPLPASTRAFGITPGPDGNVWFTEYDRNRIGRITPAGAITEFFIPTEASGPAGIVAGPDGNLWFTEFYAGKIGRVTPPAATAGAGFYPVTPCRLFDTRTPAAGPPLAPNNDRLIRLVGCGIPASARAVSANLAVTQSSATGNLTVYPAGTTRPTVSSINYGPGRARANNAILALGVNNSVFVQCVQGSGAVHFILDVTGYFQ
jgi:streptogramin lyase